MNIKELEQLTMISVHFDDFCKDLSNLVYLFDDLEDIKESHDSFIKCLHSNAILLKSILEKFKEDLDRKNWSEWQKAYPHMRQDYDEIQKEFRKGLLAF